MIEGILMLIGILFCIVSALIIFIIGLYALRQILINTFYEYKFESAKKAFKYNTMQLALSHLHDLKKQYPELKITYNDNEIKED